MLVYIKEVDELPVTRIVSMQENKGLYHPIHYPLIFKILFWHQFEFFIKGTLFKEMVNSSTLC